MSWDIYGNPLKRGHCEVHSWINEEYPCSLCIERKNQKAQKENESILYRHIQSLESDLRSERSKVKVLAEALKTTEAIVSELGEFECRQDEDCDHCHVLTVIREALEKVGLN